MSKRLVVTGSSAGGIESLSRLLGKLEPSFPAPIVIAQHLDPQVHSNLATILAKRTAMKVVSVEDNQEMLPGTVYVVPANRHVEIHDGHVALREDGTPRPKPSVDLLFATAALTYGEHLIAVVLTGMGSDGTAGARAVKLHGGTVVIEDPATASFPSMPGSLPAAMVDVIAPIDRLGAEIELLLSDGIDVDDDAGALAVVLKRVQAASGVDFGHYKMPTIRRRLARRLKALGLSSLAEYVAFLDTDPHECDRLTTSFLIKVTEFFRDPELFDWLRRNALPALIEEARKDGSELRLWSAGCATGEEAYSLAITVAEALGANGANLKVRLFATDLDESTVAFARRGVYPREALANVPPDIVARYFTQRDEMYEVANAIREMTVFGQHDLAERAPFARMDLVLCRNVLIYFSKDLQERALQLFAFALRNGGYLALGKAETVEPLAATFESVESRLRLYRRVGDRVMIPGSPVVPMQQRYLANQRSALTLSPFGAARKRRFDDHEAIGTFIMNSSIGFVMVDVNYDIIAMNAVARDMLNIHGVAIGQDLVHLVPATLGPRVRALLDAALRSENPVPGGEELQFFSADDGEPRYLSVSCYPNPASEERGAGVGLFIVDVTRLVAARESAEALAARQSAEVARLKEVDALASGVQKDLREANRQLIATNIDLRARCDSLLIGSEESAAATEEVETLNEELQATNEELETLNEEFQASIEELNTSNGELDSRNAELQELVVMRETQRQDAISLLAALQSAVDSIGYPLAVVATDGSMLVANQRFADVQRLAELGAVQVSDDTETLISFEELLRRIATGAEWRFICSVVEPHQPGYTYRGTVTPLGGESPRGGVAILERAGE